MALINKNTLYRASVFKPTNELNGLKPIDISDRHEFRFIGYAKNLKDLNYVKEPKESDLVYCAETKSEYIYFNNQWIKINDD